jgi:hypothetical protein
MASCMTALSALGRVGGGCYSQKMDSRTSESGERKHSPNKELERAWSQAPKTTSAGSLATISLALQRTVGNRATAKFLQRSANPCSCEGNCSCKVTPSLADSHLNLQRMPDQPVIMRRSAEVAKAVDSSDAAGVGSLENAQIRLASTTDKMAMVRILLDQNVASYKLPVMWNVDDATVNGHIDLWQRTWAEHADSMGSDLRRTYFARDVEDAAREFLDENERVITAHLQYYGLTPDADKSGQNAVQREASLQSVAAGAQEILRAQAAMAELRNVRLETVPLPTGPSSAAGSAGGPPDIAHEEVQFIPFSPDGSGVLSAKGITDWTKTFEAWDDLSKAIDGYLDSHPELYPIVMGGQSSKRGAYEDSTGAKKGAENPLQAIDDSLHKSLKNIADSRPLLAALAKDRKLGPVETLVLAGDGTAPGSIRNWKTDPLWSAMVPSITKAKGLGTTIAEMAVYAAVQVALGMATGGIGNVLMSGAQAGISAAEANVLSTASDTSMSADTSIVSKEDVAEANLQAGMDAAFALLDILPAVRSARGVWGAAAQDARTVAAAAKQMERDVLAYEAEMMAEKVKTRVPEIEKSIESQLRTARQSAADAKQKVLSAAESEKTLVEAEAKSAQRSLIQAEALALSAKEIRVGGVDGGFAIGKNRFRIIGNRLFVCNSPCEWILERLRTMGAAAMEEAQKHSLPAVAHVKGKYRDTIAHLSRLERSLPAAITNAERKALTEQFATHANSVLEEFAAQKRFALEYFPNVGAGQAAKAFDKTWVNTMKTHFADRKTAMLDAERKFYTSRYPTHVETILAERRKTFEDLSNQALRDIEKLTQAGQGAEAGNVATKLNDTIYAREREWRSGRANILEGGDVMFVDKVTGKGTLATSDEAIRGLLYPNASKGAKGLSSPDYLVKLGDRHIVADSKGAGNALDSIKQIKAGVESAALGHVPSAKIDCVVHLSYDSMKKVQWMAIGHPPQLHSSVGGVLTPEFVRGSRVVNGVAEDYVLPLLVRFN